MQRYNITVPRKDKNDKTWWDPVGVMFKRDKGGYSIRLSMFPELNILAFPVEPKQDRGSSRDEGLNDPGDVPDDDIPF